jgi:hypothetical protein
MPIVPETKSWTWVLERPCPECGFDATALEYERIPGLLRDNATRWPAVLERPDVRDRPDDSTWSVLEYSAHVRDVFRIFLDRFRLMLERDDPAFANWDQDATAVDDHYGEQDPSVVAREISAAAEPLAVLLESVPVDARGRTGRRSDGASFTVESLARYFIHDPVHHLWDVGGRPA